jgi:anti-sigma28 factor (negative regulator of flagellin synthesis)
MRVSQIQAQIGRGEYEVDTRAVADAIVRLLLQLTTPEHKQTQSE